VQKPTETQIKVIMVSVFKRIHNEVTEIKIVNNIYVLQKKAEISLGVLIVMIRSIMQTNISIHRQMYIWYIYKPHVP
jgi:ribosomal protein S25